jgi:alpha-beta hydrolase superfamily lysophospholipase
MLPITNFFLMKYLSLTQQDLLHEGLVKIVEETVRLEYVSSPNKPIYLVGGSFGACLALSVAARNPQIDLVLCTS